MKRIIALFTCVACVLTLASCGSSEEAKSGNAGAIKIGGSGPISEVAKVYGTAVLNAAEMAIDEINAKGGIQFDLNFQDDNHNPELARTAYYTLTDWGMQISLGTVTTKPGEEVSPDYASDDIFALTPSASGPKVVEGGKGNVFQMCFSDPNQGIASVEYIVSHSLAKKIGIIYKNDDVYSQGIYEKFKSEAKGKLDIVYEGTFNDQNATDFSTQVQACQSNGAELVFLPIYYDPASLILNEANNIGYNPIFFGVDGMDGILDIPGFDKSLAEGVYLLTPFSADATDELTVNFVNNYKEKYGTTPIQFAADAYDSIYAIYQACEKGGVTADMDAHEIAKVMKEQFTSMSFEGLTGNTTWNTNGEASKTPRAVIIKNGVYVGAQ